MLALASFQNRQVGFGRLSKAPRNLLFNRSKGFELARFNQDAELLRSVVLDTGTVTIIPLQAPLPLRFVLALEVDKTVSTKKLCIF
jgi:ABC-type multidrug transport system fused ATPase/permease subunit